MKKIFILSLLFFQVCLTVDFRDNPILHKLDFWPEKKPGVKPVMQGMCANKEQLKKCLNNNIKIIVELGSWLGSSTQILLDLAKNACVISIDHWKGSAEHQSNPKYSILPILYETFLVNMWNYKNRLIPLRMSTLEGLELLHDLGISPDFFYVDAAHDYESVLKDLDKIYQYWPKAIITGDDWAWNHKNWNFPVRRAVVDFANHHLLGIYAQGNFWMFNKDVVLR